MPNNIVMDLYGLTLPTLVRMCKKDRPLEVNVEGAETLAYLIKVDPDLQRAAPFPITSLRRWPSISNTQILSRLGREP
ncbi:armadillo repeat-containing protein 8-like [Gigantopelta aegis]|uniref:armadillo repeat-containing protein 8-like n=1 Tax=Gigantopelta aegis TaxID=1735272 RepID=UPI001B88D4FE|nr:armadillo repeat-containing protein 8-like [Gigantopelta aegis]